MGGAYKFGKLYEKKYGKPSSVAVAVGYDALMILSRAIEKQGLILLVSNYIRNLKNYDGAMGTLNFTNGDVSIPVVLRKLRMVNLLTINNESKFKKQNSNCLRINSRYWKSYS
ncbi:MAG: hypothetical protein IPI04_08895 [Ignavibacteria bacterium]|nr:hypothetical protein [Ignavibacteria bacterium]